MPASKQKNTKVTNSNSHEMTRPPARSLAVLCALEKSLKAILKYFPINENFHSHNFDDEQCESAADDET